MEKWNYIETENFKKPIEKWNYIETENFKKPIEKWDYIETENFIISCEKNNISSKVKDSIKNWARTVRRQVTSNNKKIYSHPQNIFEIWVAKIPNPDANKGKSGGYRLIYYIYIEEQKLFVDKIENRKNLDYKREKGKNQKKWNNHLVTLKKELLKKNGKKNPD